MWVTKMRESWYHCYTHTLRAVDAREQIGVSGGWLAGRHACSRMMHAAGSACLADSG